MQKEKIVIYFGDLVHDYQCHGPFTFPLNVAYVAGYAQEFFEHDVSLEFRIFKFQI